MNLNIPISVGLAAVVAIALLYEAHAGLWSLLAFVPTVGGPVAYKEGMDKGREIMRQVWNLP